VTDLSGGPGVRPGPPQSETVKLVDKLAKGQIEYELDAQARM